MWDSAANSFIIFNSQVDFDHKHISHKKVMQYSAFHFI